MLPPFELYRPTDINEACSLKESGSTVVAGGTDIYVSMHGGHLRPASVVDIKGIPELTGASYCDTDGLEIGALTPHRTIEMWNVVKTRYRALFEGCSQVGSVQIRHRGTVGGNVCNAAPSGDSIGPLLALDAQCDITGLAGSRTVPLCDFFAGPKRTVLKADELLRRIRVPAVPDNSGSKYIKFTRRNAMDLALLGVCVYVEVDGDTILKARVSLSTSAPVPMRARKTEEFLTGKVFREIDLAELGKLTSSEANPRSSWRSSREYRLALIENLMGRALTTAVARAKGEER